MKYQLWRIDPPQQQLINVGRDEYVDETEDKSLAESWLGFIQKTIGPVDNFELCEVE